MQEQSINNMTFLCGALSKLSLPQESFDLIVNFTVLEHVASPKEVLKDCFSLLKTDGLLVSAVPNHRYWWSWYWPDYTLTKLRGKNVQTHSVRREVLQDIFDELGFCIVDYDVVGFRPPQPFFCHIPENLLEYVIAHFEKIGQAWQGTFLQSLLYLEIYVCIKQAYADNGNFVGLAEGVSYSNSRPSPIWMTLAVPYFSMWWGGVGLSLIGRAFRKGWGRIGGQRSRN